MRGPPAPTRERPTVDDPRDKRITPPFPRELSIAEVHAITRSGVGSIDPRLRPADRWLERWAATGSDLASVTASLSYGSSTLAPHSSPSTTVPLTDVESAVVDGIVRGSPPWARQFAILWYRSAWSVKDIATALKIKRRQGVYDERRLVLGYFLGRFTEAGLHVTFWVDPT